jgi:hypothetical protein
MVNRMVAGMTVDVGEIVDRDDEARTLDKKRVSGLSFGMGKTRAHLDHSSDKALPTPLLPADFCIPFLVCSVWKELTYY